MKKEIKICNRHNVAQWQVSRFGVPRWTRNARTETRLSPERMHSMGTSGETTEKPNPTRNSHIRPHGEIKANL